MKKNIIILFAALLTLGCGSGSPSGEYRVGTSYAYFSSNGSVSFYNKNSSGYQNCKTSGKWTKNGDNIFVSGLYNSNCQGMSSFNGKYITEGSRLVGPR